MEEKPKGYGFGAVRKQSTSKKKKKERAFDDDSDDEDILIRTVGTPTDPVQMGVKRRHGDKDMTATELASAKELQVTSAHHVLCIDFVILNVLGWL